MALLTVMICLLMTDNQVVPAVLIGAAVCVAITECADMMQDLKSGWILGATPRRQVYAQLMGVFFGSFFCAAIFWVLIKAHPIGSEYWPAPAAVTWSGLATMMAKGTTALPAGSITALLIGIGIGIGLCCDGGLLGRLGCRVIAPKM